MTPANGTWTAPAQPSIFTGNSASDVQPDQTGELVDVKVLANWWHQSKSAHSNNRAEMAVDEDFADGFSSPTRIVKSWSSADKSP